MQRQLHNRNDDFSFLSVTVPLFNREIGSTLPGKGLDCNVKAAPSLPLLLTAWAMEVTA